jgi:hypothetical protein
MGDSVFKQTFSTVTAFLALNAAAAAQTAAPPAQTGTPACGLPAIVDTIDLKEISGSNLVTVPVQINGKPKQFLLSVSTDPSRISRAAAEELALSEGSQRMESFAGRFNSPHVGADLQMDAVDARGARASDDRPRVNIRSFTLGDATANNMRIAVASDGEIAKSAPYDGILTGDFFRQYDVELDFAGKKLTYLTPNACPDPQQVVFWPHREVAVIPMRMVGGKIEVEVTIQGHPIDAVLDTGSARTVMRRDIAESALGLKTDSPQVPRAAGDLMDGSGMPIYTTIFPQISFAGGVTALNVPAMIQTNGMTRSAHREALLESRAKFKADPRIPALTLGMDVLHQLHIYVVYGKDSIYMTAAK